MGLNHVMLYADKPQLSARGNRGDLMIFTFLAALQLQSSDISADKHADRALVDLLKVS